MKIEMAESLIRSWTRHCIGCQVAELNWKPSTENIWPRKEASFATSLFSEAVDIFQNTLGSNIFKKTSSVEQLIKQAEIDVLGLKVENGQLSKVVAVDVAFHSGGLLYENKRETAARVAKKLFRSALVVNTYFPEVKSEIIFAAPKVNRACIEYLNTAESALKDFFADRCENFNFRIIINDDFSEEILHPVLALSENVADTSELFLRSYQLINLFNKENTSARKDKPPKSTNLRRKDMDKDEINKVLRRVPKWFVNKNQINSKILMSFLKLNKDGVKITPTTLLENCNEITDFYGNYNQMKKFGENNHAKVFDEIEGEVVLWKPVEDFILNSFNKILATEEL